MEKTTRGLRHWQLAAALFLLLNLGLISATAVAPAHASSWIYGVYTNFYGSRSYQLYVPSGYQPGTPLPLVVMLHGCTQTPDTFAAGTRMNNLAETNNFLVLYPNQAMLYNPTECWNWFYTTNQARGMGEPSIIAGMVNTIKANYSVKSSQVYVAGMSAGAAMTSVMLACYSDVFAAGGVHSGVMYKAATTATGATPAMLYGSVYSPDSRGYDAWACSGAPRRLVPTIVFHGSNDSAVNPLNGEQTLAQFAQTNDYGDDGIDNDSVRNVATSSSSGSVAGGFSYNVYNYNYAGKNLLKKYIVNGMGHAWSGGNDAYSYNDSRGPNASQLMWDFFKQHSR